MKKIELIIEFVYLNRLFEKLKIRTYTIIKDIKEYGKYSLRAEDDINALMVLVYNSKNSNENNE